jgi:flagellar biogenesis protein FliO
MDKKKKRLLLQNREDLITQLYQGKLYKVLKLLLKFIWLIQKLINQKKEFKLMIMVKLKQSPIGSEKLMELL